LRAKPSLNLSKLGLIFCIYYSACQHPVEVKPLHLNRQTIIPETTGAMAPAQGPILIPTNLIKVGEISRHQVELREGPGTEFPLRDQFLIAKTLVIPIHEHKMWVKVYIPSQNIEGWIHQQAYQTMTDPPVLIELTVDRFPLVFAVRDIHQIFDYESKKSLAFSAPRGHYFHRLAKQGNMVLIYLPETRSIAWLRAGDVQ